MTIFYNPIHALHAGKKEMYRGELVDAHESPARLDHVLNAIQDSPLAAQLVASAQRAPAALRPLLESVHQPRYLDFLSRAWDAWVAIDPAHATRDAFPSVWPIRDGSQDFRVDVEPHNFAAQIGLYSFDSGTPLTSGTWPAACAGAACTLDAVDAVIGGQPHATAITRPPGHHAGADYFGGYCFINNAALAAQQLRERLDGPVAVLDVDYHHGNGTQAIFYNRADVLTCSIHGDPMTEYPFFSGHANEVGTGAGMGFNANWPLPKGTSFGTWRKALHQALARIQAFGPKALVVSLGLDTFTGDPISGFHLDTADYVQVGQDIASLGLPTVLVFEGGYAVAALGHNTVNALSGFASKHQLVGA
jgi:acetoin utilization deacetylase AcuC-like enzyme